MNQELFVTKIGKPENRGEDYFVDTDRVSKVLIAIIIEFYLF